MELLRSLLSKIRVPDASARIFKQECCISFDTPRSEGGLFIDMNTFLAFGKDYVVWNYEKTMNPVYLHIKEVLKPLPEDRPLKKPTLLAIGVEGGFDNQEPEYKESHEIIILPSYATFPFPSLDLPEKVRLAVEAILRSEGAERKEQVTSWMADKRKVSAYAMELQQIDSGVIVPPSGWKCCKCDKTENLWLNLTDGTILCGRRNWDGTGGNNHAIEHYKETQNPLAVKLGTITADLEGADVFSYPEDESVEDPLLAQHLAFFGIDFSSLKKTEMTTAEKELDHNTNYDWNRIQESDQETEPLFGPGYTGLVNLGNSCYLASTMQVLFSTLPLSNRYYRSISLKSAFDGAPADPTMDLNMQLVKLGHGLLSGKYSLPHSEKSDGISPRMFKAVIAANHPEFSSMRQQDALEFFQHLLDRVESANSGRPTFDPTRNFKFTVEDRIVCSSGKVAYTRRTDNVLSLNIPLEEATNKEEIMAFNKLKEETSNGGNQINTDGIVRPRVPLEACLKSFSAAEEIQDFYSTELNAKTTALKTTGLASFPDYLVLHMRKFVMEEGWVPKKLDLYIDVPDVIDISNMRSRGLQHGEEPLPEPVSTVTSEVGANDTLSTIDEAIVMELMNMGFPLLHCQKAVLRTSNAGLEAATDWLLSHMNDPDIDDPIHLGDVAVDDTKVGTLVSLGVKTSVARRALKATGGDIDQATDWIFSHPENAESDDTMGCSSVKESTINLPDGDGRYKLMAFISHMGTSTHCGHYVAHVLKDGRWVIFNDAKVATSVIPPRDMGYLYFFTRI